MCQTVQSHAFQVFLNRHEAFLGQVQSFFSSPASLYVSAAQVGGEAAAHSCNKVSQSHSVCRSKSSTFCAATLLRHKCRRCKDAPRAICNKSRTSAVKRRRLQRLPGGSQGSAILISLTGKLKPAAPRRKDSDAALFLGNTPPPPPAPPLPNPHSPAPFTSQASFTCCSEADSPPSVTLRPFPMA